MNPDFIPDIVKDLAKRHREARGHEKLVLEERIRSIAEFCNKYLETIKK